MKWNLHILTATVLCSLFITVEPALAQSTAFVYQGRLKDGANSANGSYDLTFALYGTPDGADQFGATTNCPAVAVSDGLFAVTLDFGANFPGADRWLEIAVRTNGGVAFTTLTPRQQLLPAPYAMTASNLSGSLQATQVTGIIDDTQLSANVARLTSSQTFSGANSFNSAANNFSGNGAGLTSLNASSLTSGTVADGRLSPNVPLLNANQTYSGANVLNNTGNSFTGNGAGLTALNASSLASGTVADARLSSNVSRLNANQAFSGANTFNNTGNSFTGNFSGTGAGLTSLNASSLGSGTVPDSRLSSNVPLLSSATNTFTGTVVASDVRLANGAQSAVSSLDHVRIVSGLILADGSIFAGTNFTVLHTNNSGIYDLTFNPPFVGSYPTVAMASSPMTITCTLYVASGITRLETLNGPAHADSNIRFIAIGGR